MRHDFDLVNGKRQSSVLIKTSMHLAWLFSFIQLWHKGWSVAKARLATRMLLFGQVTQDGFRSFVSEHTWTSRGRLRTAEVVWYVHCHGLDKAKVHKYTFLFFPLYVSKTCEGTSVRDVKKARFQSKKTFKVFPKLGPPGLP